MSVVYLLLVLAVIGLVAFLLTEFVPMPPQMQKLIIVVAILVALLYVLSAFGVLHAVGVPKLK